MPEKRTLTIHRNFQRNQAIFKDLDQHFKLKSRNINLVFKKIKTLLWSWNWFLVSDSILANTIICPFTKCAYLLILISHKTTLEREIAAYLKLKLDFVCQIYYLFHFQTRFLKSGWIYQEPCTMQRSVFLWFQ